MLKSFLAAASLVTQATTLSPDSPECEAIERAIENEDYIGTEEITAYLKTGEWNGKAGGYAIQGRAAGFVNFVSGSFTNVVGLPLFEVSQLLQGNGYKW